MKYSKIIGTGSYLPPLIFTNADWEKRVDTSHEWIVERTGIESRHFANTGETATSMALNASLKSLEMAGIAPKDLDLILVATATPDKIFPSTACMLQQELGAPSCGAFDIAAACSGFIYALSIADQFIKTGHVKTVLVTCTELMSRIVNWNDRETCVLFGDGAGSVVLQASDKPGVISTHLYADGKYAPLLHADSAQMAKHPKGGNPPFELPNEVYPFVTMQGKMVFRVAVTMLEQMVRDMLDKHELQSHHIDWLVPHQANIRIIQATAEKLGMSMDKVICTVATHANTSSASIPLALDTAVRDGRIQRGQMLLMEAIGAGMTWGSALVQF